MQNYIVLINIFRFDLVWVSAGKPNWTEDIKLAYQILATHINAEEEREQKPVNSHVNSEIEKTKAWSRSVRVESVKTPLTPRELVRFIQFCKHREPTVPKHLTKLIIECYVHLRSESRLDHNATKLITCPRLLLTIIRLSTALARIQLTATVNRDQILEVLRLIDCTQYSVKTKLSLSQPSFCSNTVLLTIQNFTMQFKNRCTSISSLTNRLVNDGIMQNTIDKCLEFGIIHRMWTISVDNTLLTLC